MLRVLRHYFPLRKALLVLSETALLWLVLALATTAHLWDPTPATYRELAYASLGIEGARLRCVLSALIAAVLAQLAIAFNELYDFRVSVSRYDRAQRFVGSMGSAILLVLAAVLLLDAWDLERVIGFPGLGRLDTIRTLVFGLLIGFALLYLWRAVFHRLLLRASFSDRVLVLGGGKAAHVLAREIRDHAASGLEVVGILPEAPPSDAAAAPAPFDPETTGTADLVLAGRVLTSDGVARPREDGGYEPAGTLRELAESLRADALVVALPHLERGLPVDDLLRCRLSGLLVQAYEGVFERVTGKIAVEAIRPEYLILGEGFTRHPLADAVKRALDLVLSAVGIVVASPVMVATAIAVKATSPGPALFTQERVGREGKPFTLLKFRSMVADAEQRTGPVWASEDDPRITPLGRFLRRTRIDELPQLFNVLAGDMSLVGPRPERPVFVEELAEQLPFYRQRHMVKPGVTGWAQINYPYGNTVEDALQKLQYDLFYVKYQSVLFDLSILFNTIKTVLLRKGT